MKQARANVDDLTRLIAALPAGEDLVLLVLKGHLVVEQLLNHYIDVVSPNPKPILELSRLGFSMRVRIAQSLYHHDDDIDKILWTPIRQLNQLRNSIAHELEPKTLEQQVDALIKGYDQPGAWRPPEFVKGSRIAKLRFAIAGVHQFLAGMITVMRLNRAMYGTPFAPNDPVEKERGK